ncbi:AMP-binding protein [Streptomyces sp. G5(2025)]|uniref:AMP-binding protein n=1 Tax=Streptomyces sp. G5(2025) TaxID=3406628 RepID=UPI003C1B55FA
MKSFAAVPAGTRTGGLHHVVRTWAARTPDADAVLFRDRRISYRELDAGARRIAARLRTSGVGRETLVGVCLERSPEMVTAVLGVLESGGAYLPLAPGTPAERMQHMLDTGGARSVIAGGSTVDQVCQLSAEVFDVAELLAESPAPQDRQDRQADAAFDSRDLAYVIYTSGSTGRPKGVAMAHQPVRKLIDRQVATSAANHRGAPVRALQYTPLTFDVSVLEIFATLAAGGTIVLPDEDVRRDPDALLDLIEQQRVTSLFLPLVGLQQLAGAASWSQEGCPSLREIMTGGEQLVITPALTEWFRAMPQCTLQNIYGPTEAHVVTTHDLPPDPADWPSSAPIGMPVFVPSSS